MYFINDKSATGARNVIIKNPSEKNVTPKQILEIKNTKKDIKTKVSINAFGQLLFFIKIVKTIFTPNHTNNPANRVNKYVKTKIFNGLLKNNIS